MSARAGPRRPTSEAGRAPSGRADKACPGSERLRSALRARACRAVLLGALVLAGCATPGPERPAPAPRMGEALGLTPAGTPAPDARWWQALGDPALDALVARALDGHPSLALARARVERARAQAAAVQAAAGPQAVLAADLTRQRFSEHGLVPPAVAGGTRTSANLQATLGWSPDLFGRHAAELAAAAGQARAAQAEAALAATGLAGQVARGHVALAHRLALRALTDRQLAQREALFALTRQRVEAGLDNAQALRAAEAAVPELLAQRAALDEQVALLRRQLALLTGQPPEALADLSPRLDALQPPPLPAAPGLDLLGRRPDIVAARWRIEAAGQDLASARAQFYPDIHLNAFVGLNALGLNHLIDLGSRQVGVSPALRLPLFDGGRLRAQQGARQADLAAAVALYDGVLLDAVREAADALGQAQALERQIGEQARALTAAEAVHQLAGQRRAAGLSGEIPVLQAETGWLAQRREALDLQARRLDARIALLQALGGGWTDDTLPALAATSTASTSLTPTTRPPDSDARTR